MQKTKQQKGEKKVTIEDLMLEVPNSLKIEVPGAEPIEILIHTANGCDALEISGVVIRHLRVMGKEPKGWIT